VRIGESTGLTATVKLDGAPAGGKAVQFSSSNPAVATVAPASGNTGAAGTLAATVTGVAQGNVTITASAEGTQASSTITVPARSDVLPLRMALLLSGAAGAVLWWWRRRRALAA
jgi:uncharacterized protein YjdB